MRAVRLGWLVALALTAACATTISGRSTASNVAEADRTLIVDYFDRSNAAADGGASAQQRFFTETQHPDFDDDICDLGGHTLTFDPTLSTLRVDSRWTPNGGRTPRGRVYVVAVTITVQLDDAVRGNQIGSVHVVVLDDAAYGFAPCPA